jgi:hypothetical protein
MAPAAGQVVSVGFEPVDVESESGEERPAQPTGLLGDDKVFDVRQMQRAEDGQQREQQGRDAGETQPVEILHADPGDRTPAAKRG